jgi:hypothetical protein
MFEKRSGSQKVFQILNQNLDRKYREIDLLMEKVINIHTTSLSRRDPVTKKATIQIRTDGSWLFSFENDQFVRTNIERSPYYAKGRFIPNETDVHFHFK